MMDELQNGLDHAIVGVQAQPIIDAISVHLDHWRLTMPAVPPLVFDFGLGEFARIGETEFWIANEAEHGYCGKYLFLFKGQRCPEHMHLIKHETFFIVKGKILMGYGNKELTMGPGDVLPIPKEVLHTFIAEETSLILELSMPGIIADNYFTDPRLGYNV